MICCFTTHRLLTKNIPSLKKIIAHDHMFVSAKVSKSELNNFIKVSDYFANFIDAERQGIVKTEIYQETMQFIYFNNQLMFILPCVIKKKFLCDKFSLITGLAVQYKIVLWLYLIDVTIFNFLWKLAPKRSNRQFVI